MVWYSKLYCHYFKYQSKYYEKKILVVFLYGFIALFLKFEQDYGKK